MACRVDYKRRGERTSWSLDDSLRDETEASCCLVAVAPGDMMAASPLKQGEFHFNDLPKLQLSQSNSEGDATHGGVCLPGKSAASPQKELQLQSELASGATNVAPSGGASLSCSWKRPYGIGAGLQNTGNTCYLNAALQCLTYTPPLANYMLSQVHSQSCRRSDGCILCAVETHFLWALHSPGDVIQPCQVLAAGFHTNRQEDAHEFLLFALDVLRAAGLPGLMDGVRPQEDNSPSPQIFGGHWRSQIQCLQCQGVSESLDPYLEIALDIQTADSVEQALQHLVQPEELGGENAYHCATCRKETAASKTLTLQSAGNVLPFVLKRFSGFTGEKMAGQVHYPECLDMRPYMSQQNGRPLDYALYAVLVHVGLRCQAGHYFCYVKAGNGHWYKMDDAKVTACDITCVLNQSAYVLFYVRKSGFGGAHGTVSPGRGPCDSEAEHRHGQTPGELERPSPLEAGEAEEPLEQTTQDFTFDQWQSLQAQNRPKSAFSLRTVEPTLPGNAIVIHQARSAGGMRKHHPDQQRSLLHGAAGHITEQVAMNPGQLPGLRGRSKPPKRKNKHAKRPLLLLFR